ncbi:MULTISPECIES: hypothetical protein [unclassified Caulobacter]|uniref:hypothetical protein n=1 Tax=unclassified Caulobacter TaxID=2648921 RepID=UPI0011B22365|nr:MULTISPECIES: hypothetical protein [unclassified Caulobacter]
MPPAVEYSKARIIAVPEGEAPLWIREKWLGLELPLAEGNRRPQTLTGYGVITGPPPLSLEQFDGGVRGRLQVRSGFCVSSLEAIKVLETASPEAANWWRATLVHAPLRDAFLMFDTVCCEGLA